MNLIKSLSPIRLVRIVSVLCFSLLISSRADTEQLLWELKLQNHALGPAPELGKNVEVRMEGGQRMLSKMEAGTQFLPENILPRQQTSQWNNILFRTRIRQSEKGAPILVLKKYGERAEVTYTMYYLWLAHDKVELSIHGMPAEEKSQFASDDPRLHQLIKFEDRGMASFSVEEWVTAEARVGNEVIKLSLSTDDGAKREMEFKTFPGSGGVQILLLQPADIASASVYQLDGEVKPSEGQP